MLKTLMPMIPQRLLPIGESDLQAFVTVCFEREHTHNVITFENAAASEEIEE